MVGGWVYSCRNLLEGTEAQRTVDVTNFLIEYSVGGGGLHVKFVLLVNVDSIIICIMSCACHVVVDSMFI